MGAGVINFIINMVVLFAIGIMFFLAIDWIALDERFKKIAKVAVGCVLVVIFLMAINSVLFGGGGTTAISPLSLIEFGIGLIVVLLVLYLVNLVIDRFAPAEIAEPLKYVIAALALIALLAIAGKALFGGGFGLRDMNMGGRRGALEQQAPFRVTDRSPPAVSASAAVHL